jgi:tRNA (guanine-N7-)-methyltransferase
MSSPVEHPRKIKSFVKRDGRMTAGQKLAFASSFTQLGLDPSALADFNSIFDRVAPTYLEIGFGSGASLLEIAAQHPDKNFIGIEMYLPGVASLLMGAEARGCKNVRVYYADAVEVIQKCIPNDSLAGVHIFFPDPWPKRKHHKRRIIQEAFIELVVSKLEVKGILHLATDWEHYAQEMMQKLSNCAKLENTAGAFQFADRSTQRPITTKFEGRGVISGREIKELQFGRCL